jgi:hypothetical protein
MNESFLAWMSQAGIVKKLQAGLAFSLVFNIFLFSQIISNRQQNKTIVKASKEKAPALIDDEANETRQSKITETELKDFIKQYLKNFFSSSQDGLEFIETFSSKSLFDSSLKKELEFRISNKINSEFRIDDLFLESLSKKQAKTIIIGKENFPNKDYQARAITLELIIDTEKILVEAIPIFKISQ